jgi:MFS family permease
MAGESPHTNEKPSTAEELQDTGLQYSVFAPWQKRCILLLAASAGWFSSISSFIYFPAVPFLAGDIGVSIEQVNLSITVYLIVSGIAPTFSGSAADVFGRRVVLLSMLAVYLVVNIGLALQKSLGALLVLRMLQSAAVSGTFSVSYGVLGDLFTPAERGSYAGIIAFLTNTPPSIGPLISALLLIRWTWRAIFWFLAACVPCVLVPMALTMPETARGIVHNGSRRAPRSRRPVLRLFLPRDASCTRNVEISPDNDNPKPRIRFTGPVASLTIARRPGTAIILVAYAVNYTVYSCLQASLSTLFTQTYNTSGLITGLIYIPFGVSCAIVTLLTGRLLDRDFRRTAGELGVVIEGSAGNNLEDFPIEKARLRTVSWCIGLCGCLVVVYGWLVQHHIHLAAPLAVQCLIGLTIQPLFTAMNSLLVDLHPDRPSTAQAACNLVRCELAAAVLAALDPMLRTIGAGWAFTVFGIALIVLIPILRWLQVSGMKWRQRRAAFVMNGPVHG